MSARERPLRPKVLHIASGDLWAGAEAQLCALANSLHRIPDVDVIVILLNHGEVERRLAKAGVRLVVLEESRLHGLQLLSRLISIIRHQRPAVVHTHRIKENVLGSVAALLAGRVPCLRTTHGAQEHPFSWRHVRRGVTQSLDWFCGRFLQQRIIAVSADLGRILANTFPPSHIRVIENGIDAKDLQHRVSDALTSRKARARQLRIGLAGRLVPVKRVDIFLATARYTLDHYPDLKASFHIYGDGPLRDELVKLNQELQTDEVVCFEGHCHSMSRALAKLDVLLMTSEHEGLPMVLLEAMVLQVPIIAHAVGGIPKLLKHGSCGVLVYKNDASRYGKELYRLLNNPEAHARIRKNAFAQVSSRYSADMNAHAYLSEYSSIAKHKSNP